MDGNSRKIIVVLAIAAVGIAPFFFPESLLARSTPIVVVDGESRLGADPGEDPHLRGGPDIQPIKDADGLQASGGYVGVGDGSINQAEGFGEGRERSLGSRVNLVWRMILWAWLCQRQR